MAPVLGYRTTALQALRGADLTGKTAVITGGNSGLGVETARALAHAGARVILTSRKVSAGEEVVTKLRSDGVKGSLHVQQLDLADLSSVKALVKQLQLEDSIDMLILNAGVAAVPLSYTKDNFEIQIGTNHFGHFALVAGLMDKLKQQDTPVRIVAVASLAHMLGGFDMDDLHFRRRSYYRLKGYGQSKLCNILFAKELARRTEGTNIEAFSLHPGTIATNLSRHVGLVGSVANLGLSWFSKSTEQGAATSVYAATAPELSGQSGAYLQDCHIAQPSSQAQDAALAQQLWTVTEQQLADPASRT
ncbi:hypothetical protein ABBQ38_013088 [Trebouxia sp. C0009 RCD-2024]